MGTVYRRRTEKRMQSEDQKHGAVDGFGADGPKNRSVHGGLRAGSGARIPWSDRDVLRE